MIDGIIIREIGKRIDERGFFAELMRCDWQEVFQENIQQINLSQSYPGIIRAWHRHHQGQVDHFVIIDGTVKLCAYDDIKNSKTYGELDEIILSDERYQIIRIPGFLWHGFKALGSKPVKLLYSVNCLYNYNIPDEERRSWNDPTLIPLSINGRKDDPRVGKVWDWNYPPHK